MEKAEILALLLLEINRRAEVMVDALTEFESNPSAATFLAAENISHEQILQAVDATVGQVLQAAIRNVDSSDAVKKKAATMDNGRLKSN